MQLVAAVEAMDLESYQKRRWPAIKQSLAKQQAYHQEFWQEAHPGRPLSEVGLFVVVRMFTCHCVTRLDPGST